MKKVPLMLIFYLLLSSCERKVGGPVPNTMINISYRDQKGVDLLNSGNTAHISAADIDVYFLTPQGERRRLYKSNLDMPEHFRIDKDDTGNHQLTIFFEPDLDCVDKNQMATMFLTYTNRQEDKFIGKFNRTKWPRTLEKLWVNDKLVWEMSFSSPRIVTLIK